MGEYLAREWTGIVFMALYVWSLWVVIRYATRPLKRFRGR